MMWQAIAELGVLLVVGGAVYVVLVNILQGGFDKTDCRKPMRKFPK